MDGLLNLVYQVLRTTRGGDPLFDTLMRSRAADHFNLCSILRLIQIG